MIENAPEDVEMDVFHHENFPECDPDEFDLFVMNNILSMPEELLRRVVDTGRQVKYEHDWQGISHFKSRFPSLCKRSVTNIFPSPFARSLHENPGLLPEGEERSACVPSPIEPSFRRIIPTGNRRPTNVVVYVGAFVGWKMKGLKARLGGEGSSLEVEAYGGDVGFATELEPDSNLRLMDYCPHEFLPVLLNQYRSFVHFPSAEPLGRAVAEAYLSVCELICNDRVGFLSYDWDYGDRPTVRSRLVEESPERFWNHIRDCAAREVPPAAVDD